MMSGIIFLGLASSVGKTTISTICCSELTKRGYDVVPFKAFNLSSNYFTKDDLIVGYAQYIQAISSNQKFTTHMNPIFKLYQNDKLNYYVHGKKCTEVSIEKQVEIADESFNVLEKNHDVIVCEGSGSFAELNLKKYDYANLRLALKYELPIIIVADISQGGIFGNLYGHIELLTKKERSLLKGIIINKYDGDIQHFTEGKEIIEKLCGVKVIGIVPKIDFKLPKEDGECDLNLNYQEIDKLNENAHFIDFNYIEKLIKK